MKKYNIFCYSPGGYGPHRVPYFWADHVDYDLKSDKWIDEGEDEFLSKHDVDYGLYYMERKEAEKLHKLLGNLLDEEKETKMNNFKFYKTNDPGGFMSNYWKARFYIYGLWLPTVEHAYQSRKTLNKEEQDAIHKTIKANDARLLGQKVKMREDWDEIKNRIMYECCLAKFVQHKDLRDQLMATGDQELIEDSPTDYHFGCGLDGTGKNMLGKILMEIREELKGE